MSTYDDAEGDDPKETTKLVSPREMYRYDESFCESHDSYMFSVKFLVRALSSSNI